jgi:archaemetzincin
MGTRSTRGAPLAIDPAWRDAAGAVASSHVVDALLDRAEAAARAGDATWVLGIAADDLVAPGRPFVFGEATVGGAAAVVSTARLRTGGEWGNAMLRKRLLVEAVHELGHVAGLDHCDRPSCVMFPSVTVRDTDTKGAEPCGGCRRALLRMAPTLTA